MASQISYWEGADRLTFKTDEGTDFVTDATQESWGSWKNGGWRPTWESKAPILPMWDRPDIFRTVRYGDVRSVVFEFPQISTPAAQILPSGMLTLKKVKRTSPLVYPDYVKYHYNVQKIFTLLVQFDTLLENQIVTFTGLPPEEVSRVMYILWGMHIVEKPVYPWRYKATHGELWRLVRYSYQTQSYIEGMDAVMRVCAFGDDDLKTYPPGSASRSTVKHNLFAAETILRVLEGADNVVGAWGDQFGAEHLFHEQNPLAEQRNSHADGVIVTNNGSIIILEIIGSIKRRKGATKNLIQKAASWTGVIANSHLDIKVLFVSTSFNIDANYIINSVDIGIHKESPRYAPDKFLRERALSHFGIVAGGLWFPEDGTISEAGTRLMGYNPHTRQYTCFDEPDPRFSDAETREGVIMNTLAAPHTPPWILQDFQQRDFSRA